MIMGLKENIKSKRLQRGLTLEDVAVHLGISRQTVQKYESGVVSNIPSDKIEKIAGLLNTTPAHLMGWDDNAEKEKPATEGDELSENQRILTEFVKTLTDDEAVKVYHIVRAALELGKK